MTQHEDPDLQALGDLLDGRLESTASEALRKRLAREPELREQWEALQRVSTWVHAWGEETADAQPPADFLDRVRGSIAHRTQAATRADGAGEGLVPEPLAGPAEDSRPAPKTRPRGRLLRMATLAYAAAALVVVGFTVPWALRGLERDDARVETAQHDRLIERTAEDLRDGLSPATDADEAGRMADAKGDGERLSRLAAKNAAERREAKDDGTAEEETIGLLQKEKSRGAPAREPAPAAEAPGAGHFGAPGGAVPRGLREPADGFASRSKVGGRGKSTAGGPDTDPGKKAKRRPAPPRQPREVLYVYETDDPEAARLDVRRLLASLSVSATSEAASRPRDAAKSGALGLGGGSIPDSAPPPPSSPAPQPVPRAGLAPGEKDAGDTAGREQPDPSVGRSLRRVEEGSALWSRVTAMLNSSWEEHGPASQPPRPKAPAGAGGGGRLGEAGAGFAYGGSLSRPLSPEAWRRLESLLEGAEAPQRRRSARGVPPPSPPPRRPSTPGKPSAVPADEETETDSADRAEPKSARPLGEAPAPIRVRIVFLRR